MAEVTPAETKVVETQPVVNEENISQSIFSKIKEMFKEETKEETITLTQSELDAKILETAQTLADEKVKEVLPKAKKEKENELVEKLAKLETETQAQQIDKSLEAVDDNFKDFVKHEANKLNIGIDEYLKDKPQYQKNAKASQTKLETSDTVAVQLSAADEKILNSLNGIY